MLEEVNFLVETAEEAMEKALDHLNKELGKITTGKATPAIVRDLLVNYYGTPTPMNQVANISTSDARSLVIQPWEKSMLAPIERSIFEANLGVTPMNDGEVVRLSFPPLTEERRRDLVKKSKALGEDAKVSSRSSRREAMEKALDHLNKELGKITTGKATPAIVRDLLVNYYGTPTPMNQVANISTSDARSLVIQPWEKSMLAPIERSIFEANLGVTPMNDGEVVRLSFPPLTEERRRDLVKKSKALGEDAKVSSRSSRREAMEGIKKAVKDGFSEDEGKKREETVQQLTDKHIKKIDELLDAKEKEIMTV